MKLANFLASFQILSDFLWGFSVWTLGRDTPELLPRAYFNTFLYTLAKYQDIIF